jgi:hypothetical protein
MGDVWNGMVVAKSEAQKLHGQIDDSHENKQLALWRLNFFFKF